MTDHTPKQPLSFKFEPLAQDSTQLARANEGCQALAEVHACLAASHELQDLDEEISNRLNDAALRIASLAVNRLDESAEATPDPIPFGAHWTDELAASLAGGRDHEE